MESLPSVHYSLTLTTDEGYALWGVQGNMVRHDDRNHYSDSAHLPPSLSTKREAASLGVRP